MRRREREYHHSELKQSRPKMTTGGEVEPEWDKRDLVYLYEDITYKGSPKYVKMKESDCTIEYHRFKQLSSDRTELV